MGLYNKCAIVNLLALVLRGVVVLYRWVYSMQMPSAH